MRAKTKAIAMAFASTVAGLCALWLSQSQLLRCLLSWPKTGESSVKPIVESEYSYIEGVPADAVKENNRRLAVLLSITRRGVLADDAPVLLAMTRYPLLRYSVSGGIEGHMVVDRQDASIKAAALLGSLGDGAPAGLAKHIRSRGPYTLIAFDYLVARHDRRGIDALFAGDQAGIGRDMRAHVLSNGHIIDEIAPDERTYEAVREWWLTNADKIRWHSGYRVVAATRPESQTCGGLYKESGAPTRREN